MSNKYRLFSAIGMALFCALAFFGVAATPAFAATNTTANPPARNAPPVRNVPPSWNPAPRRACQPNLGYRNQGASVRQLQMDLSKWGFRGRSDRPLQISGNFDDDTLFAVKQFQMQHHLPANGNVNPVLWQRLGDCGQG